MLLYCCQKQDLIKPTLLNELPAGDKFSTDWDKRHGKTSGRKGKTFFSQFSPGNYPLSEEVDPIKRTERPNLRLWTSPEFTLVGAIITVSHKPSDST